MGLHFYVKSILTVSVLAALVWFTWYKTTEVVREVVEFQAQLDQAGDYDSNGRKSKTKIDEYRQQNDIGIKDERNKNADKATDFITTDFASSVTTTTTLSRTTPSDENAVHDLLEGDIQTAEKRHVAFLKVHKTGSSTVQNIFLRFGSTRNLTFILAHDNISQAETKYPNVISYQTSLTDKNVAPPPEGRHFEIMCCHVIYNRTQFQKFLPKDTAYIGLVREPIARVESSIRYFELYPSANLSQFAANPFHYDKGLHSMSNNRMAFEFGFPLCLFPNSKEKPDNLQKAVDDYVSKVMKEFDLIMISERMDESLVLLKRALNWHTKDMMYMNHQVAKNETRRFAEEDIKNIVSHLYLDFALYQAALTEFNDRIQLFGDDFKEEVNLFNKEKDKVHNFCSYTNGEMLSFPESKWNSAYNITKNDCYMYTRFEIIFIQDIRMKMYGKLGN